MRPGGSAGKYPKFRGKWQDYAGFRGIDGRLAAPSLNRRRPSPQGHGCSKARDDCVPGCPDLLYKGLQELL